MLLIPRVNIQNMTFIHYLDICKPKEPKNFWMETAQSSQVKDPSHSQEVHLQAQEHTPNTGKETISEPGQIWPIRFQASWTSTCLVSQWRDLILVEHTETIPMKLKSFAQDGFNYLLSIHFLDRIRMTLEAVLSLDHNLWVLLIKLGSKMLFNRNWHLQDNYIPAYTKQV